MGGGVHENSQAVGGYQRVKRKAAAVFRGSRARRGVKKLGVAARKSYFVNWLTSEPEPDVIVINLRETHTIGPFIRLLDALAPHVERVWNGSLPQRALARTADLIEKFSQTRAGKLAKKLFEPPEPPEDRE
jgi:hypothetical protein